MKSDKLESIGEQANVKNMDNKDIDSVFTFRVTMSPNKSASDIHNYLMETRKSCYKK